MIKFTYPKFWDAHNIISFFLLPLSVIYYFLTYFRHLIAAPIRLPAKVICIGNINVGGTGKTQVAIWLAKLFRANNINNFLFITKGYGSNLQGATLVQDHHQSLEVGDESIMLAKYGTVIAAKKIHDALELIKTLKPEIIIVDDGMQNPNFYKDFTILTFDADRKFGNGFLIPAGPLRQSPSSAFKAANAVIVVKVDVLTKSATYGSINTNKPVFEALITPITKVDNNKNYFAFSGIGNPHRFFSTLKSAGVRFVGSKIFPDHYNYSQQDLDQLIAAASKLDATLITTRKDYVKIPTSHAKSIVCFDVELSMSNQNELLNFIYAKIFEKNQTPA